MPVIKIQRKRQFFPGLSCCFHIYIDNKKRSTLSNGESNRFKVEAGQHELQIRNSFTSTRKISLDIDEEKNIRIETFANPVLGWLYVIAPLLLIIYSTLRLLHVAMPPYAASLALFPFALFIVLMLLSVLFRKAIHVKIMD
ncbi:hypothetical protein [Roseimarinus sediminis]|uniref:hypothetical protein n=1 Tax=Roseimarinus sediminis TaxID=1610899 RepID=UPI003D20558E